VCVGRRIHAVTPSVGEGEGWSPSIPCPLGRELQTITIYGASSDLVAVSHF